MMTAKEGNEVGHDVPAIDPSTSDDSPFISDVAELERFAS